jgi:hypothetical protein
MSAQPYEPPNLPARQSPPPAVAKVPPFRFSDLSRAQRNQLSYEQAQRLMELEYRRTTAAMRMETAAVLSAQAMDCTMVLGEKVREAVTTDDNPRVALGPVAGEARRSASADRNGRG